MARACTRTAPRHGREGRERPAHHDGLAPAAPHRRPSRPLKLPPLTAARHEAALLLVPHRRAEAQIRGDQRARPLVRREGLSASARTSSSSAARSPAPSAQIPFKILTFEELGLPPIVVEDLPEAARSHPRHGPTGSGKSTTLASMIDKINAERTSTSSRSRTRSSTCTRTRTASSTSARSAATRLLQGGAQVHPAPGPRRRPHRRDARPRDHRGGAHDRRDGPPRLRDAAHQLRGADHQPHHRRLPAHQQAQVRAQLSFVLEA
jgi:hypothetical protein